MRAAAAAAAAASCCLLLLLSHNNVLNFCRAESCGVPFTNELRGAVEVLLTRGFRREEALVIGIAELGLLMSAMGLKEGKFLADAISLVAKAAIGGVAGGAVSAAAAGCWLLLLLLLLMLLLASCVLAYLP